MWIRLRSQHVADLAVPDLVEVLRRLAGGSRFPDAIVPARSPSDVTRMEIPAS
jgi:hypothetical protein